MRIVCAYLLVAIGGFFLIQSSDEIHHLYGDPNLERFEVRPGINLTMEYGSDHLACKMTIEPSQPASHPLAQTLVMSSDAVSEILDQVAPVAKRGAVINRGEFQASCGAADVVEYENVSIERGFSACELSKPAHDTRTQIFFKRAACPKPPSHFGTSTLNK